MHAAKISSPIQLIIGVSLLIGLSGAGNADNIRLPHVGKIRSNGVLMRCGPGEQYYETGRLTNGAEVTVHRRAPGGWLAIRPPAGSYSWILNEDVRTEDGSHAGEVVRDGAVVWIGAIGGRQSNRWQVRLHLGERVRILGAAEQISLNGQPKRWWRRIAPPAGEFRWIHQNDLSVPPGRVETPLAETTSKDKSVRQASAETQLSFQSDDKSDTNGETTRKASPDAKPSTAEPRSIEASGAKKLELAARNETLQRMEEAAERLELAFSKLDEMVKPTQHAEWRRRGSSKDIDVPEKTATPREVRFRDRNRRDEADAEVEELPEPGVEDELDSLDEEYDKPLTGETFHKALNLLDAEFSLMVSRPISTWQLTRLKARAIRLAKNGPTALHRGRAALLLDSIQGFDELYVRHLALRDAEVDEQLAALEKEAEEEREQRLVSNSRVRDRDDSRDDERRSQDREDDPRDRGAPRELPDDIAAQDDVARLSNRDEIDDVDYRSPTGSGLRRPAALGSPSRERSGRRFRYDAEGTLKRVTSQRRIAPPYALVDDEGEIVALVKPSPGLNLQSYVGRKVGMYGTQRTLPSFRKTLLTAERVVRMDRVR